MSDRLIPLVPHPEWRTYLPQRLRHCGIVRPQGRFEPIGSKSGGYAAP